LTATAPPPPADSALRVKIIARQTRHGRNVRLRLEIPYPVIPDGNVNVGKQINMPCVRGGVEKTAEVEREPPMRIGRRCFHHRDAFDQLPVFAVRPRFHERHELINVHVCEKSC
jgi:hypothetical protein